ncbi:MAG: topoisomerase C-terminal repeat-containing protein, partial [Planctomycetaceae bacterium]
NLENVEQEIRVGRYGPFVQVDHEGDAISASLPPDVAPADVTNDQVEKIIRQKKDGPQALGMHPEDGLPVYVKHGPFGAYLQLGEEVEDGPKPKRCSIPKNVDDETLTLDLALQYLALPKKLGDNPETGNQVSAGIGRFGPYVTHRMGGRQVYKSLGKDIDVLHVDLATAIDLLKTAKVKGPTPPLRELGKHPDDEEMIGVYEGRYGPYVKHGKTYASLPKDREVEGVTLEEALQWIAEKEAKTGGSRAKKKTAKKKTAKKKAATDATVTDATVTDT